MIVAESSRTRRLVGRLDRGTDLLTQLAEVCRSHRVHAGELRATGALEDATVGEWDQAARGPREPRRLEGASEILLLSGTIADRDGVPSLQAWVSLSREQDGGMLVGGRLIAARVYALEFVIDAFDDLALARSIDPETGLPLWHKAGAVPEKQQPSFDLPARTSWSDVIAASGKRVDAPRPPTPVAPVEEEPAPSSSEEQVNVRVGDFIDHPKFGRCAVERVDGDFEFVTARLRNQRLIRLSLDVLTLIPAGQADGKNLFRAVAGK